MTETEAPRPGLTGPVVVLGLHSAGKTTLSRRLLKLGHGERVYELGDIVRAEAARSGTPSLLAAAGKLMDISPDEIARRTLHAISEDSLRGAPIVVGPRTQDELRLLRLELHALVVAVDTPSQVRRARWNRRRLHIADTWETREAQERYWDTHGLVASADIRVSGHDWVDYAARIVSEAAEAHRK